MLVHSVKTVLTPEARYKGLHKHEYMAKEIKRYNAQRSRDDDLTYATSSPEVSSESSAHDPVQSANIGHGLEPHLPDFDETRQGQ